MATQTDRRSADPATSVGTLLRRIAAGIVFVTLFLGVMGGAHFYLVTQLALEPAWPRPVVIAIVALLVTGLAAVVLQGIPRRHRGALTTRLAFAAYTWLGFLFYLFLATVSADLLRWFVDALVHVADVGATAQTVARAQAIGAVGIALGASALALRGGSAKPGVKALEVSIPGLPPGFDGFRIVQISDIHIGPLLDRRFAQWLSDEVNALKPDLVAVTGDLVDGSVNRLAHDVEPFGTLTAPSGVYFVTGNHDFYSGAESWTEQVQTFGWQPLRNRAVTLRRGNDELVLAGVDDPHGAIVEGAGGEDLAAALRGVDPAAGSGTAQSPPVVLLAHDPSTFRRARKRNVALQLSGHTHGGQIWPFRYAVRLAVPWVAGLYSENGSQLYVSCGTGYWGPPMRLGTRAEITEITLRTV